MRYRLIEADPDDNKFVDCALFANAKFIVTEDHHFVFVSDVEKLLKNSEGLCVKDLSISALCYRTAQFGKILGA